MRSLADLRIGAKMALGLGAVSLLFLVLAGVAWQAVSGIGAEWDEHSKTVSARRAIATGAGDTMGDAIHWFKNYVIRGGDYSDRFAKEMDKIEKHVAAYRETGSLTPEEWSLLDAISAGGIAYSAGMHSLVSMRETTKDPVALDKAVRGADGPLVKAVRRLIEINADAYAAKTAEITQQVRRAKQLLIVFAAAALAGIVFFGYVLTRSITAPIREAARVAQVVASGDLSSRIEARGGDETGQMMRSLRAMNEGLGRIVADVRAAVQSITAASGQIVRGNTDMSQRTEEQASHLEETASSMEQLTATVKQNADNASVADRHVTGTAGIAQRGKEAMGRVVATMEDISGSSKRIVDIIGVIDTIAFQTNILALNAAVEAARAGEQGRGFAVVAAEVRSLAQRSAEAAKEIKSLIGTSVASVQSGTGLVGEAGKTIDEIVESVQKVKRLISEIATASHEQRSGIEQINKAVTEMEKMTQQNAALVEQSAAAAESLDEHAQGLARSVEIFKLESAGDTRPSHDAEGAMQPVARRLLAS